MEYKIEPTDKAFIGYDNQYSQEDYLPGAVPLNLQNSQTVDSLQQHIVDILPPTDVVPEVAAYQQVRTENAFNTDKYSSSESYMLGDSGYDEQIMTGFSDHCHDYSQQSCSGCPNPSSSSYSLEQSEEEYRHYVQDPRNDTYAYSSVMQNNGEYTNYYRNSEGQEYKYDFAAYGEHEPRKRRTLDNDSLRVRASSNCQLNPTAVAIMDAWYRKHLDRPYPNKEEKMSMAIAGSITETQVCFILFVSSWPSISLIKIV